MSGISGMTRGGRSVKACHGGPARAAARLARFGSPPVAIGVLAKDARQLELFESLLPAERTELSPA